MIIVLPKTWEFIFEDGAIYWKNGRCDVSPEEAVIFGLLDKAYPHKVNGIIIKQAVWPVYTPDADLPDDPGNAISAVFTHIRRKLESHRAPLRIPPGDQHGYWVEPI
jgi:hypothetical protein